MWHLDKVYLVISPQQNETVRDYLAIILQGGSLEYPGLWLKLLKAAQFTTHPKSFGQCLCSGRQDL